MMTYQLFAPKETISADIQLDGSKSISNRLLVLQHISEKPFKIGNLSISDDTRLMGEFFDQFPNVTEFNVQNAGTVARFLTAFCAVQKGEYVLNCAEPMKKRPIKILVDALRSLGAQIDYLEEDGFLPLKISGGQLKANEVTIAADVSSQYISALMMIAPKLPFGLTIHLEGVVASRPYLEITENLMNQLGFTVDFGPQYIKIDSGQKASIPAKIFNESDWSAAAFYYTICSMANVDKINLQTLFAPKDSFQGDAIVANYFESIGVDSLFADQQVSIQPLDIEKSELSFDFLDAPDMVPALATAVAYHGIKTTFTGVRNLVIKESNRLVAMKNELYKLGVSFYEIDYDTWQLEGKIKPALYDSVTIETYDDHRIAMAFGCLGFTGDGLSINNPGVVSKSYTQFWHDMETLGLRIEKKS